MKRIAALIAIVIALANSNIIYPLSTVVTGVDYDTDIVTVRTFSGIEYQFSGTEDWLEGDIVALLMFSNGTDSVLDDAILKARYSGFVNQ